MYLAKLILIFDSFFSGKYTFFWFAIIANPELIEASNRVLSFISNLAQSSRVLVNGIEPISSDGLYVLVRSNPINFSM